MKTKTAIVLLNLGGPDSLDAVEPFLYNLFSDPDIIDFPLSFLFRKKLAKIIANKRAPRIREQYQKIGGKSPIMNHTQAQAQMLEERLNGRAHVYIAMRYWNPMISEAVNRIKSDGIEKVVLLPMYPQYSKATTGSSINEWNRQAQGHNLDVETHIIESYHTNPLYIKAVVERIREALVMFPEERRDSVHILFSAHGTPMKLVKQGDPYSEQISETVESVMKAGEFAQRHHLCFQSKVGPMKWLTPSTHETILELASNGVTDMLVVPIAFVSDHLETLYEINIEYRRLALENGIENFEMTEGLNGSETFIDALEQLVQDHCHSDVAEGDRRIPFSIPLGDASLRSE
jgi:ferrochelatase